MSAIDSKLEQSLIKWNWIHVKGHQGNQFPPLDIWESLNVECETAVKQIWDQDQENTWHTIKHNTEN